MYVTRPGVYRGPEGTLSMIYGAEMQLSKSTPLDEVLAQP